MNVKLAIAKVSWAFAFSAIKMVNRSKWPSSSLPLRQVLLMSVPFQGLMFKHVARLSWGSCEGLPESLVAFDASAADPDPIEVVRAQNIKTKFVL